MATQNNSTDDYATARFIVSSTAGQGNYSTIASALAAASSGNTIFILPGTYTEDITLKAGVNLTAFSGDGVIGPQGQQVATNVIIKGTTTATYTGQASICGIQLTTNGSTALSMTGSNICGLTMINSSVYAADATGCTFNNSSSVVNFIYCTFTSASTNSLYTATATGGLDFENCVFNLSGTGSACTIASGRAVYNACDMPGMAISTSSGGGVFVNGCYWQYAGVTLLTTAGSGTSEIYNTYMSSTTASAISVGSGTIVNIFNSEVLSGNTNAITGAGTLNYGAISFIGASSTINTTTAVPVPFPVLQGGTGISSVTAYAPLCGGTTSTGALQAASTGISNSGYVLTSNGASALPSFQLNAASSGFTSINIQQFTTSGTYTPTSGMIYCTIQCLGAGGAGGGSPSAGGAGSGGAAGGYSYGTYSIGTVGVSQSVTIGSGGTGVSNNTGNSGGTSSVGSLISCTGGSGGGVRSSTGNSGAQGTGGSGSGGQVNIQGGGGSNCYVSGAGYTTFSGTGATSYFGNGGATLGVEIGSGSSLAGLAAQSLGAGGGGSVSNGSNQAGGAGADGIVIITEYLS